MHIILSPTTAFFMACWVSSLSAEPYHWFSAGVIAIHPERIIGGSPGEVCEKLSRYVPMYYEQAWNTPVQGSGRLGTPGKTHVYCYVKLTYIKGSLENTYSIFRGGDECLIGSYDPISYGCSVKSLLGTPPPSCGAAGNQVGMLTGNPIDFTTGNKIQQEVDLYAGRTPVFFRTYNSLDGRWRHNYEATLNIFDNQNAVLTLPSGREIPYNTYWTPAKAETIGAGLLQKEKSGWTYVDFDNSQYFFDHSGTYIGGIDAQKNIYSITRKNGNIIVIHPGIGQFMLIFNESGELSKLITPRYEISYQHHQQRLTSIEKHYPERTFRRTYHYEDPRDTSHLTGITDERGIRYASWSYDDQGRAISSSHTDEADNVSINYLNDDTVILSNPLNKRTTYRFMTILGHKRVTAILGQPSSNCSGTNSYFEYNQNGLMTRKVDNKGIVTNYSYDTNGREYIRTEAIGTPQERKITTFWHPYLFLPVQVGDNRRTTIYDYDSNGRLTKIQHNTNF